ncbi:MAG: hypothetical protein H6736_13740 [Alphaproteobacteria bacterium]|nr:hypothetical protein [Alphaproteobacteria bacterium]MCB9692868.1 hypothetical protein [Alphaproteobacteria bacterium]
MARSLTVKHEENLSVSPLFAGFVLLAITCLMLSAATGWAEPGADGAADAIVTAP